MDMNLVVVVAQLVVLVGDMTKICVMIQYLKACQMSNGAVDVPAITSLPLLDKFPHTAAKWECY